MRTSRRLLTIFLTASAVIAPTQHPHLTPDRDSKRVTAETPQTDPWYQELPLRAAPAATSGTATAENTKPFAVVAVTWPYRADSNRLSARIRIQRDGAWTEWESLRIEDDHAPEPGEARPRSGTEPRWVGAATGVEASVTAADGSQVTDARVVLIQPGTFRTDEDIHPGPAIAPSGQVPYPMPMMASRKRWRADERLRRHNGASCAKPKYTKTVLAAFVHHTADRNDYTRAQVPAMVRAMYAYHVKSRGWCDLGYNFLVDRFGRVFEGRYGGAQLPVLGAHTGSFNANSFGVALIGNFEKAAPSPAMLETTARVIAWKLDAYYRPPKSTVVLAGSRLHTISGHRDTKNTACPGSRLYGRLSWLRQRVDALTGGSVSTPIYRFARRIGFRTVGLPFWGEHRTKTGWATYFGTRDVFSSALTGTHSTAGVFRTRYRQLGPDVVLGLPTGEQRNGRVRGVKAQSFRNGAIFWSKSTGARPISGLIYRKYAALGAERSRLGLPITDMYRVKSGVRQKYQHGWLTYNNRHRKVYVQYRGTA